MEARGSYFFVIDSFIAGIIILTAITVVVSSFSESRGSIRPVVGLNDMLTYMEDTEVREFDGNRTQEMIDQGNITDPTMTLFSQVGRFHQRNKTDLANVLIGEVVNASLPPQYSIRYRYNSSALYERNNSQRSEANFHLTATRTSIVSVNRSSIYGPYPVTVEVWTS